jgi:succinate-semialdehyde dehydrogenase/glutarate-semialdehyde dehydrogenase
VETPRGTLELFVRADRGSGAVDFHFGTGGDLRVSPTRLLDRGEDGVAFEFTVIEPPDAPEGLFDRLLANVERELEILKQRLERKPSAGATFAVLSPATGEQVGRAPNCGEQETRAAIEAAAAAFPGWSQRDPGDRAAVLARAGELMLKRGDELARLMALESGKPITEARGEVGYAAGFLAFFGDEATRVRGEEIPSQVAGKRLRTIKQPVGVSGLITIWNFPAAGITRPLGAALAAGCTAVVKPAEQTPLTAIAVVEILDQAGLPAGASGVVTAADPEPVGRELLSNPVVRKLSFTGSAEVGARIARGAAAQAKRVTLEMGGNAPLIVFADADLDAAAEGALRSKFRFGGQTCVAVNRIFVERSAVGEFTERFVALVRGLRVGDPLDESVDVGPLIDADARSRVESHVEDAVARGATLLCGGRRSAADLGSGLWFEPTVLGDVPADALVMREETFGPVAPIASFASEAEVVDRSNELPGGLAAFFYTADEGRATRLAERLEYGIVGVNDSLPVAPNAPFGGIKRSGIGKEGGRLGLEEFLETKLISVQG